MTDNWRSQALCGQHKDPDLWFREGPDRALALHICKSHCTVRTECAAANLGLRNAGCVVAGVAYNQHGAKVDHRPSSVNCPTCTAARAAARPATVTSPNCGTPAGYRRHIRNHQTPCRPCSLAAAENRARQREAKAEAAA